MAQGLTLILGTPEQRRDIVRRHFPHLDDTEVAWVADNMHMIAESEKFVYDGPYGPMETRVESQYVGIHKPMKSLYGHMVFVIHSIRRDFGPFPERPWTTKWTHQALMAPIKDRDFLARARSWRIGDALS